MADQMDVRTSLAVAHDAAVAVDITALLSDTGVPLDLSRGDQHVVAITPVLACSHSSCRAVPDQSHSNPRVQPQFNASEHMITVSGLKFLTDLGPAHAESAHLPLSPDDESFTLTYGQIMALGGDLYGDPEHPISVAVDSEGRFTRNPDAEGQFTRNFGYLAAARDEVGKILQIVQAQEFGPIEGVVAGHGEPSSWYSAMPKEKTLIDFGLISISMKVPKEDAALNDLTNGRYLALAVTNYDHFGVDAVVAYTAGHHVAQQQAASAKGIGDPTKRTRALGYAYAMNAFADHFLSDLFAAGHMRTPRRQLKASSHLPSEAIQRQGVGWMVHRMHDEDNKFGLWVRNDVGDHWVAYGDARYRDTWNSASRVILRAALQQSMKDIWDSFDAGQVADTEAGEVLRYIPNLITAAASSDQALSARNDPENWAPLFWWDPADQREGGAYVWCRQAPADPGCREFFEPSPPADSGWDTGWVVRKLTEVVLDWPPLAETPVLMPERAYGNSPYPPDETGPSGQFGWPPIPGSATGPMGATGPTLGSTQWSWSVDGAPGPTHTPNAQ